MLLADARRFDGPDLTRSRGHPYSTEITIRRADGSTKIVPSDYFRNGKKYWNGSRKRGSAVPLKGNKAKIVSQSRRQSTVNASTDVIRPAGARLDNNAPTVCQNAVIRKPVLANFSTP
jgi:hypothetical protein